MGLGHAVPAMVEAAARAAADHDAVAIHEALSGALTQMLASPKDPGCGATLAVLDAMRKLHLNDRDGYRAALLCDRLEPVYGGSVDVGAHVRASACSAIVESGDSSAALLLAGTLFERQTSTRIEDDPAARVAAARGLGFSGDTDAVVPLRIKIERSPSDRAEVIGECVGSIVRLAGGEAMSWLTAALDHQDPDAAECAVVAVGETRGGDAALRVLRQIRQNLAFHDREERAMIGFALLRHPAATDDLLEAAADRPLRVALAAAAALHSLRHDPAVAERFERLVDPLPEARVLREAFATG